MNKKELIANAQAKNIPITESKLNRYINLGLLYSDTKGRGRAKGTLSHFTEESLDILKEIQNLKGINQKHIIFTLFWRGYNISWHKLKDAVYNFALEIEDKFTEVNNKTKDPEFADYILNEMIEESVPKKKPGRPSNQDLKELKQQQEAEKESFRNILSLVQLLAAGSSMTCQGLKLFSRPNPNVTTQTIADADMFLDWLNLRTIKESIQRSEKDDYDNILEIIHCIQQYWNEIEAVSESPTVNSVLKEIVHQVNRFYPGGFTFRNVTLIRYLILAMLAFGKHQMILEFLKSDQTKTLFNQLVNLPFEKNKQKNEVKNNEKNRYCIG
ncbi:hypothetical protein ACIFQM_24345 [Paenibacillus sp. NRS-1782]|uniref:hypothetical protein n=1 Tax=unclassified Paenibacillus TaxID=185978 RepID=UPI003D2942B8